ncbi:MAG: aldo/keto reductase [Steroidobacteraceae bacterium]
MNHKTLGRTTVAISEVGLGTWGFHGGADVLRAGLDAGALFVDTAESYGTESVVAEAIRPLRDKVFLATKVSRSNLRPAALRNALDGSLSRLGTDYVDLYQIHEPNPDVPLADTLGTMEDLVDEGKIRFVGLSNFGREQLIEAQATMRRHPIVSNQVRYNLADRTIETNLLGYCQSQGITVIAYSPLGRELQRILDCDPTGVLPRIKSETGKTVPQIALNWCLCHDNVVVIPRGNSTEHVVENCGSSGWRLAATQIEALNHAIRFKRRGRMEQALRRLVPGSAVATVKRVVKALPPSLRRRIE